MRVPDPELFRIGEAARRAGVTTRTLRYYQEVGLLQPSGATPGGNRLYTEHDVERLRRILELRDVMGFDLERIGLFLGSEDRLAEMRAEVRRGASNKRRAARSTPAGHSARCCSSFPRWPTRSARTASTRRSIRLRTSE